MSFKSENNYNEEYNFRLLISDWLVSIQVKVEASTYAQYSRLVEKHIIPTLHGNSYWGALRLDMGKYFIE